MEKLTQKITRLLYISFLLAVVACTSDYKQQAFAQAPPTALNGKHLGTPSEYKNLKIYLIEGEGTLNNKRYLTLDQALESKKAIVIETGNVNELSIDNLSGDYIFIHSGDMVKGGQQDRTIGNDILIEPNAKKVKLPSFCVEHNRWSKRGNENVKEFSSSKNMLPSKKLKIASRYQNNQQEVWNKVEEEQEKYKNELSKKANKNVDVKSAQSSTSLQLALENDSLLKSKNEYLNHLKGILQNNTQAIGMAVYINNELSEINIYNNHALFRDLSAKLLDAAILEAISEGEKDSVHSPAEEQMKHMLSVTEHADTSYTNEINKATRITTVANKTKQVLLFETEDQKEHKCLHYNYLKTDDKTFIANKNQNMRPLPGNRMRTR
ncbi:MAG: hypothetical protein JWM14_3389 [Chitinophagaceae bacterium]|nr:hypothetical protein [Chitinophagaceae bacterium]